jgi:hypothetical protein
MIVPNVMDFHNPPAPADGYADDLRAELGIPDDHKPIVVNNYAIYDSGIRPKGFRTIEMENFITGDTIRQAREVLTNDDLARYTFNDEYAANAVP